MKYDLNVIPENVDGAPISEALPLSNYIANSLATDFQTDAEDEFDDKVKRFKLAQKCHCDREFKGPHLVELSHNEITMIRNRLTKMYGPVVIFAASKALENGKG